MRMLLAMVLATSCASGPREPCAAIARVVSAPAVQPVPVQPVPERPVPERPAPETCPRVMSRAELGAERDAALGAPRPSVVAMLDRQPRACRTVAIVGDQAETHSNDYEAGERFLASGLPFPTARSHADVIGAQGLCRIHLGAGRVVEANETVVVHQPVTGCAEPFAHIAFSGCRIDPALRYTPLERTRTQLPPSGPTGDPIVDHLLACRPLPVRDDSPYVARWARVGRATIADETVVFVEVIGLSEGRSCFHSDGVAGFFIERWHHIEPLAIASDLATVDGVFHDGEEIRAVLQHGPPPIPDAGCEGFADCHTVYYSRLEGDRLLPTGDAAYDVTSGNLRGDPEILPELASRFCSTR